MLAEQYSPVFVLSNGLAFGVHTIAPHRQAASFGLIPSIFWQVGATHVLVAAVQSDEYPPHTDVPHKQVPVFCVLPLVLVQTGADAQMHGVSDEQVIVEVGSVFTLPSVPPAIPPTP